MRQSYLRYALLALSLPIYALAGYLAWLHWTQGPPAQPVHIRWAPTVSAADRTRIERDAGLAHGVQLEGRTWQYFIRKRSSDAMKRLISDPRVEDTFHIDRALLRVQLDRPDLSPHVRALLESDRLGEISVVLALIGALMTWWSRRTLVAIVLAVLAGVYRVVWLGPSRYVAWIERIPESHAPSARRVPAWLIVLTIVWAAIVIPYLAVGPPDMDEYYTGVVSTKVAITALRHGAWPFWNLDFGLGVPQPLRYHFIFHPLAPLCLAADCQVVLRSIVSIHLLVSAVFVTMLALRFTRSRLLASAAGLTYCMSSSVANLMFTDDWPLTMLHESVIPVMVYAVLAIGEARERRDRLLWTLVLGVVAGLILSVTVPFLTLITVAIIALSTPELRRRLPWFVLSAAITVLIGAPHVHHMYAEYMREPRNLARTDHDEYGLAQHLWSAFLRPLPVIAVPPNWRTVFFGPPFAVAATIGAATIRDARVRPIALGFLVGVLGFVIPPGWLFDINTAQWTYRAMVNVFGILLAIHGIDRWTSTGNRLPWRTVLVAAQLCWVVVAFAEPWYTVFALATGRESLPSNMLRSPGIAEQIAAREHAAPGRIIFAPRAHDALWQPVFNAAGLAPNELPVLRVPTVSVVINGISADDLYPQYRVMESAVRAVPGTVQSGPLLDVIGVRYILGFGDDTVARGLPEIQRWKNGLRMYENRNPWPEAFFVDALRNDRIPRLPDCGHDRFLCADFSKYDLHRRDDPLQITRLYDGVRLTFPPRDSRRHILITQWYYPEWRVTDGRASLQRAAEQLIGVEVAPGESTVTVQYRPYLRAALFAMGIGTEVAVGIAIVVLVTRSRKTA